VTLSDTAGEFAIANSTSPIANEHAGRLTGFLHGNGQLAMLNWQFSNSISSRLTPQLKERSYGLGV
jgi:hypothetical protein